MNIRCQKPGCGKTVAFSDTDQQELFTHCPFCGSQYAAYGVDVQWMDAQCRRAEGFKSWLIFPPLCLSIVPMLYAMYQVLLKHQPAASYTPLLVLALVMLLATILVLPFIGLRLAKRKFPGAFGQQHP